MANHLYLPTFLSYYCTLEHFYVIEIELEFLKIIQEQDINIAHRIYQNSLDIPVVVLHYEDYDVIIMSEDYDYITNRKGDVVS